MTYIRPGLHKIRPFPQIFKLLILSVFLLLLQLDASRLRAGGSPSSVRRWYEVLPPAAKARVAETGFEPFILTISARSKKHDKKGLQALVERWMDTTHTFHLPVGEMTITPGDFAFLTGISCEGRMIEFDCSIYTPTVQAHYIHQLLGFVPRVRAGVIAYGELRAHWERRVPTTGWELDKLVRSFLLYSFGCTLFADAASSVDLCLLPPLRNLDTVREWDWGSPALASLYRGLDRCCRGGSYVQGYGFLVEVCVLNSSFYSFILPGRLTLILVLLQAWAYEFRVLARPFPISRAEVVFPSLSRWDGSTVGSAESHDISVHRARLNELTWDEVLFPFVCFFPFYPFLVLD